MNRLRIHVMHRVKLGLFFLIRFVISRPRLLAISMYVVNRIPALKWRLWRIHASMRAGGAPAAAFSDTAPAVARPVLLQLIEPEGDS